MSDIKVYTLEEVADILKVTRRTLYLYIKEGKSHAVKAGKGWRVTEKNLRQVVNMGCTISDANRRSENQDKQKMAKEKFFLA